MDDVLEAPLPGLTRLGKKLFFSGRVRHQPRTSHVVCASSAGLHRMAYTEWGDPANPRVLFCVHGLTRNSRDFDYLAASMSDHYRVICPDVVGRGESDWLSDSSLYVIPQYVSDLIALLARSGAQEVDWIGTSMGGLIGMSLAAQDNTPIRRLVMNDVGAVIPMSSMRLMDSYLRTSHVFADLAEAEAHLRDVHSGFGQLTDEQWQHLTRHSFRQGDAGYAYAHDPAISDAFRTVPIYSDVDLWSVYRRVKCPTMVLRGADSNLLTAATMRRMAECGPEAITIEFPGVGHAPPLMSAEQITPIRDFLLAP